MLLIELLEVSSNGVKVFQSVLHYFPHSPIFLRNCATNITKTWEPCYLLVHSNYSGAMTDDIILPALKKVLPRSLPALLYTMLMRQIKHYCSKQFQILPKALQHKKKNVGRASHRFPMENVV